MMSNPPSLELLIIGKTFPEPQSSAAGSRMMQLIELFKKEGWTVVFASPAGESPFSEDLKIKGIPMLQMQPNTEKTTDVFKSLQPDVVLFDRFMMEEQFGWRVAESCPDALRILDTEDLHFLRRARRQAVKNQQKINSAAYYTATAKREIASILRCDLSLIISEQERHLLIDKFKLDPAILYYLPFLLPPLEEEAYGKLPGFRDRKDFMFIGNFIHPPNYDAVLWMKEEIWPLIRSQLPKTRLMIYGAYGSEKVRQLHNEKEGFVIVGRTRNKAEVLRKHRLLLAPLRYGAGLKGKILEAMRSGFPTVTTPIGAEGISGTMPFPGEIAQNAQQIAEAAINLYTREKNWQQARNQAPKIINARFKETDFKTDFIKRIITLKKDLEQHRQYNFIGEILKHHRQQSTKYMSRWIEAKNKLKSQGNSSFLKK